MNILPVIAASTEELEAIFRDLHAHPEIGFTEVRTSAMRSDQRPPLAVAMAARASSGAGQPAAQRGVCKPRPSG